MSIWRKLFGGGRQVELREREDFEYNDPEPIYIPLQDTAGELEDIRAFINNEVHRQLVGRQKEEEMPVPDMDWEEPDEAELMLTGYEIQAMPDEELIDFVEERRLRAGIEVKDDEHKTSVADDAGDDEEGADRNGERRYAKAERDDSGTDKREESAKDREGEAGVA